MGDGRWAMGDGRLAARTCCHPEERSDEGTTVPGVVTRRGEEILRFAQDANALTAHRPPPTPDRRPPTADRPPPTAHRRPLSSTAAPGADLLLWLGGRAGSSRRRRPLPERVEPR